MEMGEAISTSVDKPKKLFECKWKDCPKKHEKDINPDYGKGSTEKGNATSGKDYEKEWLDENMEPWQEWGKGIDPNAGFDDFANEIDSSKPRNLTMINKAVESKYPDYITQKHHIISVNLFDNHSKLAHNAELVDYNVNDKENGICLPYYVVDIVQHDLQCHRGPHPPSYNERLSVLLKDLETNCLTWCDSNMQPSVKVELEMISSRVGRHIENWKPGWYIRSTAKTDRASSYKRIGLEVPK